MHLSHPVVLPIPSIMHQTITVKNLPAAKAVCICVSPTHSLCINLCLKNLSFPPSIDQYALSTIHPPIHHSSVHHREESVLPCLFPAFHQYAVCFYLIHPSIMHQSVTAKNLSVLPSVDLYALCACLIHPSIMHQSTLWGISYIVILSIDLYALPFLSPSISLYTLCLCICLFRPSIMDQSITVKNLSLLSSVDLYAL